ncbi:MAG: sulfite exporter TauE/SafE family protein [Bacteroidetes bacterium]|nr:sulfite exporter TauE/SafE family protein [Bacteroidota bacterium]
MNTWINQVLSSEHAAITILAAVFLMGMISVVTCGCNFAVIGVVAGYSGATSSAVKTKTTVFRGLAFLLGGVISMAIIGLLFGYAGQWISSSLGNYGKITAALIAIFFGIYSMDFLPFKLPGMNLNPERQETGTFAAILFGLAVGGLFSALNTCCNPLFPIVLAATFVKGSALWGFMMLTTFALGYCIPLAAMMIGLSVGIGRAAKTLNLVGTVVKYIGGVSLVLLGFYLLVTL